MASILLPVTIGKSVEVPAKLADNWPQVERELQTIYGGGGPDFALYDASENTVRVGAKGEETGTIRVTEISQPGKPKSLLKRLFEPRGVYVVSQFHNENGTTREIASFFNTRGRLARAAHYWKTLHRAVSQRKHPHARSVESQGLIRGISRREAN